MLFLNSIPILTLLPVSLLFCQRASILAHLLFSSLFIIIACVFAYHRTGRLGRRWLSGDPGAGTHKLFNVAYKGVFSFSRGNGMGSKVLSG